MKKLLQSLFLALLLSLGIHSVLHAQTTASAPAQTPSQAPEEVMKRLADLVHSGKYAEAQQLAAGLSIAYPDDPRLIRIKALLDKTPPSANAAKSDANSAAGNSSAQPSPQPTPNPLTGMDKVDYSALIELARQAQQTTDLPEQTRLLAQFMNQSALFLQKHPDQMLLWQLRAASAISLNAPLAGFDAGQRLLAAGAADSSDPNILQLLAKLKLLGWMDQRSAEQLQLSANNELRRQAEAARAEQLQAEHDKYTFPVAHSRGFSYTYGHLSIEANEATYVGPDENIRLSRNDIRELRTFCVGKNICGMYFVPKDGRKFFFVAVTEAALANRTFDGKIALPPSVLGNAAVERWKFVSIDRKTLGPPKVANNAPPSNTPALQPVALTVRSSGSLDDQPPAQHASEEPSHPATLHVYRPHRLTAAVQKPDIFIDGKKVAHVANSQSVRIVLPAGKHTISVSARHLENEDPIADLEMVSGNEYWIRVEIAAGAWSAHVKLSLVPTEQAQSESAKMAELRAGDLRSE